VEGCYGWGNEHPGSIKCWEVPSGYTIGSAYLHRLSGKEKTPEQSLATHRKLLFFVLPFCLQSVLVHSANCVKDVYSGM
jgi:hypothetical protein